MNAIEDNRHSRAWAALGEELARAKPSAIVAVSAHFLPLAYVAGAAGDSAGGDGADVGADGGAGVLVIDEGRSMGSLSMTGYLYR